MSINILNKYFYDDISYIIIEYLAISEEEAIWNKGLVIIHLNAMFELRRRVKENRAATFSFVHGCTEIGSDVDLYFKDVLTTMIVVKD
jgi:hypothetical protein